MSYCDDCIHNKVCGEEGVHDDGLTFCKNKKSDVPRIAIPLDVNLDEAIRNDEFKLIRFADVPEPKIENRWIPVTERLPDSAGVYIVSRWFSDGCDSAILTDACYFDGTDTWHNDNRINHGREYVDKKIVAWMPLPEPWKGEEE